MNVTKIYVMGMAVMLALAMHSCSNESSEPAGNGATTVAVQKAALLKFNEAFDRAIKLGPLQMAQHMDPAAANQQRLDEMFTEAKALLLASGYTQTDLDKNYDSNRIVELAMQVYLEKSANLNQ